MPLFDARQVEERLGEVVSHGALAALDLVPGRGVVRHVVAEAEVMRADRLEDPACATLVPLRDHRTALRTTRAR